ncbi:hypothetical protein ABIF38_004984 [Bradyrhizobium japonicum]|uniref:DUF2285 domain-containing protein n=1 Tax=Bradyrhizobium elkanii TaxID=29448 RepID=UPI001FCE4633|nr:DUF2285 domain-containing protein [Bradyrhizobium elkanii]MCP1732703.1 hypothetical protein [Bradyrhizobium elkanii]MCS3568041.1 hypothetical protein [Bradyrhizobium elkanii]MCS3590476.1 hypothetical protein [Bradyrhizobium elkanii]MCS3619919.1 hypothetical protein [Bradyrhizobium elkanii]MCW2111831.1 hypothetical protein [Bradyrhizobium elkanii]
MTTVTAVAHKSASQPLLDFTVGQVCHAADGWHAVLHVGSVEHRIWSQQPLTAGAHYAAELPLDRDFEARAHAATRLWRAMNGRAPGPGFHRLSKSRRERLCAALRAVAAHFSGATYRSIAEVLFGQKRIPGRAWKTHDLRSRTIRLVKSGLAFVRGGYRKLLRLERKVE